MTELLGETSTSHAYGPAKMLASLFSVAPGYALPPEPTISVTRLFAKVLGRLVHPPACDRGTGQLHGNLGIRPGHQTFADEGSLLGVASVQDPRHLVALGQRLGFDPFCTDGVLGKGYRPEPLLEVPSTIRRGVPQGVEDRA